MSTSLVLRFLLLLLVSTCTCSFPKRYTADSQGVLLYPSPGVLKYSVVIGGSTTARFCTGTIIDKDWVLTAAHCLLGENDNKLKDVKMVAGVSDFKKAENTSQERHAEKIIVHPKFVQNKLSKFDIALIKVADSWNITEFVDKVEVGADGWPQGNGVNRTCISSGYGSLTLAKEDNSRLKMWKSIGRHGEKTCPCTKSFQWRRMICLQPAQGVGLCKGDDGGGLVCYNGTYPFDADLTKPPSPAAYSQLRLYGVAHTIQHSKTCSLKETPGATKCGDITTISMYMYLCPLNKWISEYVPGVPPTFENCRGAKTAQLGITVVLSFVVVFTIGLL